MAEANLGSIASLEQENAALQLENAALRADAIAAGYVVDPDSLELLSAPAQKVDSPNARVDALRREHEALQTALILGQELMALREANSSLVEQSKILFQENVALQNQCAELRQESHPSSTLADPVQANCLLTAEAVAARAALTATQSPSPDLAQKSSQDKSAKEVQQEPRDKAEGKRAIDSASLLTKLSEKQQAGGGSIMDFDVQERQEMVAAMLKAGLFTAPNVDDDAGGRLPWKDVPSTATSSTVASRPPSARTTKQILPTKLDQKDHTEMPFIKVKGEDPSYVREQQIRSMLASLSLTK